MAMNVFRWLFEDRRTGRIVIGQTPNLLLLIFLAATAARWIGPSRGAVATTIRVTQAGSLFLWALDELVRGVNPFRRIGGAVVIATMPFMGMLR